MSIFPTKILLATDGSEDAALAARAASNLAEKTGAELHVVHVVRYLPPHAYADARPKGYEDLYHQQVKELLDEQVRLVETEGGKDAKAHFRLDRRLPRSLDSPKNSQWTLLWWGVGAWADGSV